MAGGLVDNVNWLETAIVKKILLTEHWFWMEDSMSSSIAESWLAKRL